MIITVIAVVPSVTTASRVKRRLERKGIRISVIQTPRTLSVGGCGYSVRFSADALPLIKDAVRGCGSHIKAVFEESKGGKYTRME